MSTFEWHFSFISVANPTTEKPHVNLPIKILCVYIQMLFRIIYLFSINCIHFCPTKTRNNYNYVLSSSVTSFRRVICFLEMLSWDALCLFNRIAILSKVFTGWFKPRQYAYELLSSTRAKILGFWILQNVK